MKAQPTIDVHVNDELLADLKIAKKRIEVYLEALEWIEDHDVAIWDNNGKAISPGAVASSAREKARRVASGQWEDE